MSFADLGLSPELLRAVAHEGYTEPTPVQAEAIPLVLAGRDLLAGAQTGTGKTAAFVLPMLQRLARQPAARAGAPHPRPRSSPRPASSRSRSRRASAPTAHEQPIQSVAIYGGVGFDPQVRALRNGPEIVVATPGRLLDHVGQRTIDLSQVEILVLDEADRMLDMGFIRDIRKILALLPAKRQNLLFSATFSDEIRQLAGGILHEPATVQVTPRNTRVRAGRAGRPPGRPRAQARAAQPPGQDRRHLAGAGVHPHQARREPARPAARARTASPPPRSTATRASRSACARWPTSRPTGPRSSSPPRSPPAASTSTRCRTS